MTAIFKPFREAALKSTSDVQSTAGTQFRRSGIQKADALDPLDHGGSLLGFFPFGCLKSGLLLQLHLNNLYLAQCLQHLIMCALCNFASSHRNNVTRPGQESGDTNFPFPSVCGLLTKMLLLTPVYRRLSDTFTEFLLVNRVNELPCSHE